MNCPDHPAVRRGRALSALLCIVLALLLMPSFVQADPEGAYSGGWDKVQWKFDGIKLTFTMPDDAQTGTATVYMPNVPNDEIRQDVQIIEFNGPVTVRQEGFTNCPKLKKVYFKNIAPDGLAKSFAFQGCTALEYVSIHNKCRIIGDGVFYGCTSLEDIDLVGTEWMPKWNITEIGSQAFCGCAKLKADSVNRMLNWHPQQLADNVQSIGTEAFKGCSALEGVTIPQFVESVGKNAFKDCKNLEAVIFTCVKTIETDDGPQYNGAKTIDTGAFAGCTKLESVTLPASLETFEGSTNTALGAFEGCTALARVTTLPKEEEEEVQGLPKKVEGVLYNTFKGCQALSSSIHIPAGVTELNQTFAGCKNLAQVTFAEGGNLTKITAGFQGCALTQVAIPSTVTDLDGAFSDCTGLTSVAVPEGVTNMHMAFNGCTNLKTVTLPNSVVNLNHAFDGCKSLQGISIPSSVTELSYAFNGCSALKSVEIPEGFTGVVGSNQTSSTTSAFYKCTSLTNVSLPDSLRKIGVSTFEGCTALTEITIPANVTAIGGAAFRGCTKLGRVAFAEAEEGNTTAMTIGSQAFKNCSSLTAFSFPKSLTKIESNAFENTALQTANLSAVRTGEAIISTYAFSNCKSLKTVVVGNGFKVIDYRAFEGCSNLETLTLGEGIRRIGERAFNGAPLKDVTFPAGLE